MSNNTEDKETEQSSQDASGKGSGKFFEIFSKYGSGVIVCSLAAIIVLVVVVVLALSRKKPETVENKAPETSVVSTNILDEMSTQIKLILFDNGFKKDVMDEKTAAGEDITEHNITVVIDDSKTESVKKDILSLFAEKNLIYLYSDDAMFLSAKNADNTYRINIHIEKPKPVVKPIDPPKENIPPIKPAKDFPYGVTPPAKGNGRIALLIDDCGANLNLADRLTDMDIPLTLAVLPHLQYSRQTGDLAKRKGKSVFLHFPMEPLSYPATDPGEGAALVNMPELLIQEITKKNIENIGSIDGANNHMGSAYTENGVKMLQVLNALRPYTNTFVDSSTSTSSVAYDKCREAGFKCGINKKFLDNDSDHAYITSKIYEAAELSNKNGGIIVIGHLRPDTVAVLEEIVPFLQSLGYRFEFVSTLTK